MLVIFTETKVASNDLIMQAYKKYCEIFNKCVENMEIVREGKPYFVVDNSKANIYFSLTHSGKYIFVAISDKKVGIDLQLHDKKNIKATAKYLFGQDLDEKSSYDRYTTGEAHVKYAETTLLYGLKEKNTAQNYFLLKNYSLAIESDDKSIYFMEL